jgi:capsular polysaccharide biosynthesis protein
MGSNVNNAYPEEISLREMIEILIKRWKLIVAVTLIAIAVSAVFSYFVIRPKYEAEASVWYKPVNMLQAYSSGSGTALDGISVEDDMDTLITLIMYGGDLIKNQVSNMTALLADMADFNSDIMTARLKEKGTVEKIYADVGIDKAYVSKYAVSVTADEANILGIKVSGDDPKTCALLANRFAEEVESIYKNEAAARMETAKRFVSDSASQIAATIRELENDLNEHTKAGLATDKDKLEYKLMNVRLAYNELIKQDMFLDIVGEVDIAKTAVKVISNADVPSNPVSPRKSLNIAIAGVLGLMVSVFVVFIKDYWEKTGGGDIPQQ